MSEAISRRDAVKALGISSLLVAGLASGSSGAPAERAAQPAEYALPPLPYGYDSLEPLLDSMTLTIHHDRHHGAYVKGLNAALARLADARAAGDHALAKHWSKEVAFNGSGHVLHSIYWMSMKPGGGGTPSEELADALARDFGSFEAFKSQFAAASISVEGSGWGVLAYEPTGRRLLVLQAEKHQNLTVWGVAPVLVCDVWEHAYYLKYQNRRADYVTAFLDNLVNWEYAARQYVAAAKLT